MKFLSLKEIANFMIVICIINPINLYSDNSYNLPTEAKIYAKNGVLYNSGLYKVNGSLGWRTNNPGNIKHGIFSKRYGSIGVFRGFAIFPSVSMGYSSMIGLLKTKIYRNLYISNFIERYSPRADDNDTEAYTRYIFKNLNINHDKKIKNLSKKELKHLVWIISLYEGFSIGDSYILKQKNKGN